jgi:hypothetical protein
MIGIASRVVSALLKGRTIAAQPRAVTSVARVAAAQHRSEKQRLDVRRPERSAIGLRTGPIFSSMVIRATRSAARCSGVSDYPGGLP